MNIIKDVGDELSVHHHLTDVEIIRFIYLYCCNNFYFDKRWVYCIDFCEDYLKEDLRKKHLNLENITYQDRFIICHTFIREIMKPLIDYYTSSKCETKIKGGIIHSELCVSTSDDFMVLNPTPHDLQKVKYNLPPQDFDTKELSQSEMRLIDEKLGYKFDSYDSIREQIFSGDDAVDFIHNASYIISKKSNLHCIDSFYIIREFLKLYSINRYDFVSHDYDVHRLLHETKQDVWFDLCKIDGSYKLIETDKDVYDKFIVSDNYVRAR